MPNPAMSFDNWYSDLGNIARKHGISVADVDAWREAYETGQSPLECLAEDYPEILEGSEPLPQANNMTAQEVADKIGQPLSVWPGNCYAVACSLIKADLVKGRAAYGHFIGRISPNSMFFGKPIVNHGWVITDDGQLIDPTRWVFEGVEPYIYCAPLEFAAEYDEGGNIYRLENGRDTPPHNEEEKQVNIPSGDVALFNSLLGRSELQTTLGMSEVCWLGNLSLVTLQDSAKPLYEALIAMGMKAMIPLDNRTKIFAA